ncbi:TIGR03085 family metal-binding protein [Sanguibacter sp. HDW7]|uniref:TIGR03085 family metal-binding protein n=1 Tax=Sanguibacter sp. HDW7 TaxID=2714931 RepID=UPI0014082DDA|nr:TIGR03085 family metal-binding protein [Sanguibacter sp. HDW7]QIK83436.1 TIGR03085 family protein [Sanguibacter sp. HDW7]
MTWHQHERETLATLLHEAGPDAPTLCEGWRTRHLAVHLAQRELSPWMVLQAVPGPIGRRSAATFDEAVAACAEPTTYHDTIDRWAAAPAAWSPRALAGDAINLVEFFVHGEDVRRASDDEPAPAPVARDLDPAEEDALWQAVRRMTPLLLHRCPVGVVHVLDDGRRSLVHRPKEGRGTVVVTGGVGELALHAHGRGARALVQVVGSDDDVATLELFAPTA